MYASIVIYIMVSCIHLPPPALAPPHVGGGAESITGRLKAICCLFVIFLLMICLSGDDAVQQKKQQSVDNIDCQQLSEDTV